MRFLRFFTGSRQAAETAARQHNPRSERGSDRTCSTRNPSPPLRWIKVTGGRPGENRSAYRRSVMQKLLMFGLHFMIGTTIMGIFVTAALSTGHGTARTILLAALAGFLIALPVTWLVARRITHLVRS
jgi:hypothetical protein